MVDIQWKEFTFNQRYLEKNNDFSIAINFGETLFLNTDEKFRINSFAGLRKGNDYFDTYFYGENEIRDLRFDRTRQDLCLSLFVGV